MKYLTLEQRRKRMRNINTAETDNRSCFRRYRIHDYIPGQAVYQMESTGSAEQDYTLMEKMAASGVRLIQVRGKWNDFFCPSKEDELHILEQMDMKKFVDLCHYFEMKAILYLSSIHFHGLPRVLGVLDKCGFDGICHGWDADSSAKRMEPEVEDCLGIIYQEIKKRSGIHALYCEKNVPIPCIDKVYDYLEAGGTVKETEVGWGKELEQYIVPCQSLCCDRKERTMEAFAKTIPFMQFPLLAQDPESWGRYMELYRPMVEENSVVYMELQDSASILSPLDKNIYASMFVNEEKYLVVSNLTEKDYVLELRGIWEDRESKKRGGQFIVKSKEIAFLKQVDKKH